MMSALLQGSIVLLILAVSFCDALRTHHSRIAFVLPHDHHINNVPSSILSERLSVLRGGATVSVDEDEDEDEEVEEEDEEEQEEVDAKLAASAVKSASKSKAKKEAAKAAAVKKAVSAKMTTKKKSSGLSKLFKIPYIVKATLNPFTFVAMTRAYWASLFNLDFLKPDPSQELRSALEQKAKKSGGSNKGKRKMKRGQAKTLSDLPALNT